MALVSKQQTVNTVGTSGVQLLLAANGQRMSYIVANRGASNIYIGGPTQSVNLTTATGFEIAPSESLSIGGDTGALYAVASADGQNVHVAEVDQT